MAATIRVFVAVGLPQRQRVKELQLPVATTAREAVELSQLSQEFPEIDFAACRLANYGEAISDDYLLEEGDRIEVCRPLLADPRDARRKLAQQGLTMGLTKPDEGKVKRRS